MNNSRIFTLLGIIVVAIVALWMSAFIVYPRQQVVIKRFGEITRVASNPGLYFKVPFIDQMVIIDSRLLLYDLPTKSIQVSDGATYEVDAFFVYKVSDPMLFLQRIDSGNPEIAARNNLSDRFDDALRAVYGTRDKKAALSFERGVMMSEIQQQLSGDAKALGITIVDVRIRKTDLTGDLSESVYANMNAERATVAEKTIAEGQQEKERIIAEANRLAQETVAKAQKQAQETIGEGEAQRLQIIQDASKIDPSFYVFWESMESYKQLKDTPMVISPNWDFFNYMANGQGGKTQASSQAKQQSAQ